jgi:hypothetical protein
MEAFNRDGTLPIFETRESLDADPAWKAYILAVYGSLPQSFPASLQDFVVLYQPDLYMAGLKQPPVVKCPTEAGQCYLDMSGAHDPPSTLWVWHPPPFRMVPDGTWTEVTHCVDILSFIQEGHGAWMYVAPGSGVFYNSGRTMAFDTHLEAVRHFLGEDKTCDSKDECLSYFAALFANALSEGYDSLQFLKHGDQRCGLMRPEIVDLRGTGRKRCENIPNLRTGWHHELPCDCDRSNGNCTSCRVRNLGMVPVWLSATAGAAVLCLAIMLLVWLIRRHSH